jgi:HEAT repeat protein
MKRKDSFLRGRYVAIWPKLPAIMKSRLKQPMSAAAIRVKAVGALRQMGHPFTDSDIGLSALTTALNHPDIELRSRAEGALGDLGPQAKAAVPTLIKSVERRTRTGTGHMDINGIWALGRIGPDAKVALPLLESIVKQKGGRELVYAAEAVLKIGGDHAAAIAALEKALKDPDSQARREAAEVLKQSEHPAEVGASALTQESIAR